MDAKTKMMDLLDRHYELCPIDPMLADCTPDNETYDVMNYHSP